MPHSHTPPLTLDLNLAPGAEATEGGILMAGPRSFAIGELPPFGGTDVTVTLVATACGLQRVAGLCVLDEREQTLYDTLSPLDVFVQPLEGLCK